VILSVAVSEVPLREAVITADVSLDTAFVVTENVTEVVPAATTAVPGAVTELEPLVTLTVTPPLGAGLPSVTVAFSPTPPATCVELKETALTVGGSNVKVAVLETEPSFAVIVMFVAFATGNVEIENEAVDWPAGTTTLA